MSELRSSEDDFLIKITEIIEDNITNEQFGVSELAHEIGMSRSNLLRKIKKLKNLSVSQFIRQIRLKSALELLQQNAFTVSEVSYKVGFSSPSYFIKCFHDHYGYPPGEAGKREPTKSESGQTLKPKRNNKIFLLGATLLLLLSVIAFIIFFKPFSSKPVEIEKSIAVLPFKNDSNDSTNVFIINGLMESILNNLQKIEDLRVISRTSVEKYRNSDKTISEIAKELNVNYFVEGSGQKIDDQILLNIQLIEAKSDKHLWASQYERETKDIFVLQNEVAKNIAGQIEVIITPEEEERINKIPTDNLVAYEYFLKGLDLFYKGNREALEEAIVYFKQAIEHDPEFARAYADIAISYYYLDVFQSEKKFSEEINNYADKALLLDSELALSLIAKALFYMNSGTNDMAVPYLEKALEYNPNSALVINLLSDFYANHMPDTEKYLKYALKGVQLDIASHDSILASFIYLHLSNALIQSGFVEEAKIYIDKSLEYDPNNLYSEYVKAYIIYAANRDLSVLNRSLIKALEKDTTRLDIIQEVGKSYYYLRDFPASHQYYKKFIYIKKALSLDIYRSEDAKIGVVLSQVGLEQESEKIFANYKDYAENDQSIYKHLSLAVYYGWIDEKEKAMNHLRLFSQEENYHYWTILFLEIDPLVDKIKDLPEFRKIMKDIKTNFWKHHKEIKSSLEENNLL